MPIFPLRDVSEEDWINCAGKEFIAAYYEVFDLSLAKCILTFA